MKPAANWRWICALLLCSGLVCAQEATVTARVAMAKGSNSSRLNSAGDVVLWLVPGKPSAEQNSPGVAPPRPPRLIQRNKSFDPHILVVPVGSVVQFPNRDPFFHNVFSLFEGKRFDLGLYEAGSTRDVRFDKPGISYIFCNIHPEMSAVVIALDTPYFAISDQRGEVVIPKVPFGRYTMRVWYEGALPETLKNLARETKVSEESSTLGVLHLKEASIPLAHKNLYGRDYDPPAPPNPVYEGH